jgi:hypothetical protein
VKSTRGYLERWGAQALKRQFVEQPLKSEQTGAWTFKPESVAVAAWLGQVASMDFCYGRKSPEAHSNCTKHGPIRVRMHMPGTRLIGRKALNVKQSARIRASTTFTRHDLQVRIRA